MLLPHRITATVLTTYATAGAANRAERQLREILGGRGARWELTTLADRPPLTDHRASQALLKQMKQVAAKWKIPLAAESSVWPSVAGLAPAKTAVLCGIGPVATNLYTPEESVQRISLIQRTLLLAEFLLAQDEEAQ